MQQQKPLADPSGPITFIFIHILANILPNNRFFPQTQGLVLPPPDWEILDPPPETYLLQVNDFKISDFLFRYPVWKKQ